MINLSHEESLLLRPEYEKYLVDNERHRLYSTKIDWPLSFDAWFRAMADEAKEKAKYE
jgi:hypothetical protein